MKLYGIELTTKNGKLVAGNIDGMAVYPMRWDAKEKEWVYCVGKYTKEYFRKLIKNGLARFDFVSIK